MRAKSFGALLALTVVLSLLAAPAALAATYDEGVSGDLSSNPSAPTPLGAFGIGTHSITTTSSGAEQDDYTFILLPGTSLSQIVNFSYNSPGGDNTAFIGLASGSTIDTGGAPASLMGYTHFGPNFSTVGTNILDDIAVGPGTAGFTPPVGPGTYSIWSQQAGSAATYRMDFVVVPEPTSLGLLGLSALFLGRRRNGHV